MSANALPLPGAAPSLCTPPLPHANHGAQPPGREAVISRLNEALASELICFLRYKRHHCMAGGIHARSAAKEFLKHADEELAHADLIARRIIELQGEPDFSPADLTARGHSEYAEGGTLSDMIREDLTAERIAIDAYAGMIRTIAAADPATGRMLEGILAMEREHAADLAELLKGPEG